MRPRTRVLLLARFAPLIGLGALSCGPSAGSPSGTLYFVGARGPAALYRLSLSNSDIEASKLSPSQGFAVAPDGAIVYSDGAELAEAGFDGGAARTIVAKNTTDGAGFNDDFWDPAVSDDGKLIAYGGKDGDVFVVDRASGALILTAGKSLGQGGFIQPSWTPEGRVVVAGAPGNPGLFAFAADALVRIDGGVDNASWPAVSSDGQTILFTSDGQIWGLSSNGAPAAQLTKQGESLAWAFWSPEGGAFGVLRAADLVLLNTGSGDYDVEGNAPRVTAVAGGAGGSPAAWR